MVENYTAIKRTAAITSLACAFAVLGYVGFLKDHKNPKLTSQARQKAYEAKVLPMTSRERFLGEFVTGMTVCNLKDNNDLAADLGIFTGPESCGLKQSETDERIGRTCLKGTSYDISDTDQSAQLQADPSTSYVTIIPKASNQYKLHIAFTPQEATALDDRTKLILHDYGCPDI